LTALCQYDTFELKLKLKDKDCMPKKTLREKLLAQTRREKFLTNFDPSKTYNHDISPTSVSPSPAVTIPTQNHAYHILNSSSRLSNTTNYSYVLNDLKRIFVISGVAFCFEGLLYFFLVKQFHIF